jgi:N-acetylneuraminic acid mutarotase
MKMASPLTQALFLHRERAFLIVIKVQANALSNPQEGKPVRHRCLLSTLVTLGTVGLAACGEEATQPNTAANQPNVPQLAVASSTWIQRRLMPLDVRSPAAANVPNAQGQSILYVMGGQKLESDFPNEVPLGEVRAYNVATNTWIYSKRDMPAPRYATNGAGVIGGKIYVSGGYTSEHKPSASLFVYDPASNTWNRKRDMPAPGGWGVTGVIQDKLYVATLNDRGLGIAPRDTVADFFRYDPTKDSWTKLAKATGYSMDNPGGGVVNDKFYLIGPRVLEYDPNTNQWTKKGPWGPSTGGFLEGRTAVLLAHLYVFGFEANGSPNPIQPGIFIYNPANDSWAKKSLNFGGLCCSGVAERTPARVFLNGKPRVEWVGWLHTDVSNNLQYVP